MMSFFPGSFCAPAQPSIAHRQSFFDDVLRELGGIPAHSAHPAFRRARPRQPRSQASTFFNPRFDIRETETAYEFYGELPGLQRENLNIQLLDPQTLVISGNVERNYSSVSNISNDATESNDTAESTPSSTETEKPRRNSHQATVEDDPEDESITSSSTPASRSSSPWSELAEPAERVVEKASEEAAQKSPAQTEGRPQYLRQERSVGQFSRIFTFGTRVDEDHVTASLDNGILSLTVPKQKQSAPRKIEITV